MSDQPRPPLPVRAWRYYQRHGVSRLLRRVRDEFSTRRGLVTARPEDSWLPSAGISEIEPDQIEAHLDAPIDGAVEPSGFLLIGGWACSPPGVTSIEAYVDGQRVAKMRMGQPRPDVADFLSRIPGAGASGFNGEILVRDLNYGAHRLELVIEDTAGHRRVLQAIVRRVPDEALYNAYFRASGPSATEMEEVQRRVGTASSGPEIVVWVLARDGARIADTLRSIEAQMYPRWRCLVVAEGQGREIAAREVGALANPEAFTIVGGKELVGSGLITDGYCAFLEEGELLTEQALFRFAARTVIDGPDLLYSDHDRIRVDGWHVQPAFNPDWSPDYGFTQDYVGGVYLLRDELRRTHLGTVDTGRPAWRYDLLLRVTDDPKARVGHVPQVLWSAPAGDDDREALAAAEIGAVDAALERRGSIATVIDEEGARRVKWPVDGQPRVSIIVPTTAKPSFVQPLVESLTERTEYTNYELLFIDNSRGRHPEGINYLRSKGCAILERDEEFNWAKLNNDGARATTGDLLLFLNDDIEVNEPGWLTELVGQAQRPDIGAVGALLIYPDGRIQHAGVFIVGYGGGAVHMLQAMDPAEPIYRNLHRSQREVSAVTGACMMVRRSVFDEAGGFDERLEIAGNDIDLCLRLLRRGYRNIWTPYARLVHHESASRLDADIVGDETKIWQIWGDLLRAGDPYHSPHFAKNRVDFAIDSSRVDLGAVHGTWLPPGVNLIGYIRAEMGVGQATRGTAAALKAADVPFTILDYQYGNPSRMSDDSWAAHVSESPAYDMNVVYVNADLVPEAFSRMPEGALSGRYTIGSWTWELPEFPDDWIGAFQYVDEVWVPSTFVQQAVAAKSSVPVVRMPFAVQAAAGPFLSRDELGIPRAPFLYLMMYDVYSVRQRKNPEGAIAAFTKAFAADDTGVGLVIKLNNADRSEREVIDALVGERRNITVLDRTMSRHEVDSLIAVTDCFLSLHRSEGFGLAIAEAMALGKPVVATNWSGNTDFMNKRNAAGVDYELERLADDYGPYRAGQHWADPDIEDAARLMRELSHDRARAAGMGRAAAATIAAEFSPEAVGQLIDRRLHFIRLTRSSKGKLSPLSS